MNDELLEYLGDYFVNRNMEEKLNITFEEFVNTYLGGLEILLK